jgi:hypothetical protein
MLEDRFILRLNDGTHPIQTFVFKNDDPPPILDYEDGISLYCEVLAYDLDGDAQNEILVSLSDHTKTGYKNWDMLWCVGYTSGEGFWIADGEVRAYPPAGSIMIGTDVNPKTIYLSGNFDAYNLRKRRLEAVF